MLLSIILARWRHPVASIEALDLLHWAMHTVTYRHIAMAIKMAIFARVFVNCCLYACCPGGRWGNTEQVVARCRHPVASVVALDTSHWAMPCLYCSGAFARPSKLAATEVHFDVIVDFVIDHKLS
jgi:hypothetical protein